jgi:CBS domain-containing protein
MIGFASKVRRRSMNVNTCMSREVRIASPAQSIRDVARTMKEIDAGFLPVGENDRLIGMITDRDIAMRAVAEGKGPETTVRDVMTEDVCYCYEDEDLASVAQKMADLQVRRLPVLNRSKRLVGIISLADIARAGETGGSAAALSGITAPGGRHVQH